MSIQTTISLTRTEAEERLREKRAREADISRLTDEEIENELEETYRNFSIVREEA